MNRRNFIKYASSSVTLSVLPNTLFAKEHVIEEKQFPLFTISNKFLKQEKVNKNFKEEKTEKTSSMKPLKKVVAKKQKKKLLKEKVHKDIFLKEKYLNEFISVRDKLTLVQKHVGYGNFNILSLDAMLKIAKRKSEIGSFSKKELAFLELIFYYDPAYHGFYGSRVSKNITQEINKKEVIKIPQTGHYLFRGVPEKTYYKIIQDVGDSLTLTSGVRSIVKQTKLFLDKLASVNGNLSIVSKSLAPPAYTYHSIADFDVGKKGFGVSNFTPRFALTKEFLKMRKLKYIEMRYTINNKDGVRYEPWHVKVI